MLVLFEDRVDAGQRLASALRPYAERPEVVVLGLPPGGVAVAFQVAEALEAPLDVLLVRRLGVPGRRELTMGALAPGGVRVLNDDVVRMLHVPLAVVNQVTQEAQQDFDRCAASYRGDRPPIALGGQTVVVVDDGCATGVRMRAALAAIQREEPAQIVVAVPTAPAPICKAFEREADAVVCLEMPHPFLGVGVWYTDFSEPTDGEVRLLLARARDRFA
jgi:putative phosphoribosyl transferase